MPPAGLPTTAPFRLSWQHGHSHKGHGESIFITTFHNARNYFERTVESTARAITAKTQGRLYRVTIFVDGLTRPEQATFTN